MKQAHQLIAIAACLLAMAAPGAHAQAQTQARTKEIVLDQVNAVAAAPARTVGDAMVVSVLVESQDGSLKPRAVNSLFRTGERFRVKVLPSRDGTISLYNTKPTGETTPNPVWRGKVTRGLETVTPRLRLEGTKGTDRLHVVFEPVQETNVFGWLTSLLSGQRKDIRLDAENTSTETYLLGANAASGLMTTLHITHR